MDDSSTDDELLRAIAHVTNARGAPRDASDGPDPERVAHFRVDARLGCGGMGIVYRAFDEKLRREVALKVLPRAFDTSDERRRRFVVEARAAAAITHPNVAAVYEVGEDDGRTYIAMELVAGETLREHIARGPIAVGRAAAIARDITRGLDAAHAKGIVHRDLKPDNVMITVGGAAKILDFGLARALPAPPGGDASTVVDTEDGRILGTVGYMAPEQARGAAVDARTDLFALGVVLYEMLTGERPFRGDTPLDVLVAVARDPPMPLGHRAPRVPRSVERVVERLLAKSPDTRYANAAAALEALERCDQAERRRTPARIAFAIALGVVSLAVVIAWTRPRSSASAPAAPSAARAAAPEPSSGTPLVITRAPAVVVSDADASREYALAMQALRDGAEDVAIQRLRRAADRDPGFAAAQLRLALFAAGYAWTKDTGRRAYAAASRARASLAERDLALLRLAEPLVVPDAPDFDEAARRIGAMRERFPNDAELRMWGAIALFVAARYDDGFAELGRAEQLDPEFAWPIGGRMQMLHILNRDDEALAVGARCLAVSSSATLCIQQRLSIEERRGACAELEADARRLIAIAPDLEDGYQQLALALLARDAPVESFHQAERKVIEYIPNARDKRYAEAFDEIVPRVWHGDFTAPDLAAFQTMLAPTNSEERHATYIWPFLNQYRETGDPTAAARLAQWYVRQLPAWTHDQPLGARGEVLASLVHDAKIAPADARRLRDEWLAEARAKVAPADQGNIWLHYFAVPARTAEEALAALAARDQFPATNWTGIVPAEALGRLYLLAGRPADAVTPLREATQYCGPRSGWELFTYSRAQEELGEALEATGDRAGACASYAKLLARWGAARPRSASADAARAHARALGCAP